MADDLATRYAQQTAGIQRGNSGASGGFASNAVYGKPVPEKTQVVKPPGLPNVVQKGLDIGKQIGNVGSTIAQKAGKFVVNSTVDIARAAISTGRTAVEAQTQPLQNAAIAQATKQLAIKQSEIVAAYKSGKMSKKDYTQSLLSLSKANSDLSKESLKISSGPTPLQRATDLVDTAANVLTLGSFTTTKALAKAGAKDVLDSGLTNGMVSKLEGALTKVPALKSLASRNAAKIVTESGAQTFDQALRTNAKNVAIGLLIKRPIFYQMNVEGGKDVYKHIMEGNYPAAAKSAAWLGVQMLDGGPIGAFLKGGTSLQKKLGALSYGKGSFIDEISKQIGNGNPNQIARYLQELESGAKGKSFTAYHGSTSSNLDELIPGSKTGLNEKRNLIYLAEDKSTAANYAKTRGTDGTGLGELKDSPSGKVYDVNVKGSVLGAYDRSELDKLKNADGYEELSAKTKNQLSNDTGLSADILESNEELVSFLDKNGIGAVKLHLINGGGSELAVLNPVKASIKDAAPKFDEANRVFKILQETNLRATNEDVTQAVDNVMTHYTQHGISLENITPSQLYKDFSNWARADELAQKTLKSGLVKGITPENAQKYVVVRWDNPTKQAVADTIQKAGTNRQNQLDALNELANRPGVGWGNNDILRKRLENIIATSNTPQEAAQAIRRITTASTILSDVPKVVSKELSDLGYSIAAPFGGRKTPIVAETDLRKLVTGAIKGESDNFDLSHAPEPNLSALAGALEKSGLSPRATNSSANRALQESVVANLDELGVGRELGFHDTQGGDILQGGKILLTKLQQYVENKRPALGLGQKSAITDIRQLTNGEVQEALGVTSRQAKDISHAVMKGYLEVPLEFRGLGDKAVDALYTYNPLHKYYSRIQSALRYTYNPFFRTQERVETKLLSHMQANNLVWGKSRDTLNDATKVLDDSGIFTSSLSGEAAQDLVLGRLTANITQAQKRDLAGLALDLAKSRGVSLQDMVTQHADELDDALRVVVQYPKKGVLASSLARTLNVAFFPLRYNTKVTMLAAQAIAKQPPSVQAAMLHSMLNMKDWLKSDEGIKWQSEHADAIQLFQWLTPIGSIQSTFNLLSHKPNSISELGQLGGLPLGLITQILDGQGIINLNTPYVNPKTGEVLPEYIPESAKARAATALTDLLGTTFTYPGRILGLPGKDATLKKVVKAFIDTNGTDFEKRIDTDKLTPLQKQWVKVLKGDTSKEAVDALYNLPAQGGYQGYTLPPLNLPYKVAPPTTFKDSLERRRGLPSKGGKTKKTKNLAVPITSSNPLP